MFLFLLACRPTATPAEHCRHLGGHPVTECHLVRASVMRGGVVPGIDVYSRCVDWCLDGSAGSDDAPAHE